MRKHVAPAHPDASIPDPDRGGFLPPAGRTVSWTPHWAGLAAREEISVSESRDEPEAEAAPAPHAAGEAEGEPHDAAPEA